MIECGNKTSKNIQIESTANEVKDWLLNVVKFEEDLAVKYGEMFAENEIKTVADVKENIESQSDLKNEIGIKSLPHRRQIWKKLKEDTAQTVTETKSAETVVKTPKKSAKKEKVLLHFGVYFIHFLCFVIHSRFRRNWTGFWRVLA